VKPSPPARGSPQDKSWEGYHPQNTPTSVPLTVNTPHSFEWTPNDVRDTLRTTRIALCVHVRGQWYQNNLIGIIHISPPQKEERSRKSTKPSMYWSSPRHIIILIHTRPHMDRGPQLMRTTNPGGHQDSKTLPGE